MTRVHALFLALLAHAGCGTCIGVSDACDPPAPWQPGTYAASRGDGVDLEGLLFVGRDTTELEYVDQDGNVWLVSWVNVE